ncbi:nitrite reductase small subunit NirD [Plantibacter flavus]|uniref:nitrite reductase small subunit NirD n=1 Tax=Plantibacter flavus TaxID=150123 RepID=UPI003F14B02A
MTITDPTTQRPTHVDSDLETWTTVCPLDALLPERGAAALVDGEQIALFRLHDGGVRAVQQADPYADHANVMSRGLVGQRGGRDTVASPMYKHVFDLADGACLDSKGAEPIALRCWPVRVADGLVLVGVRQGAERAA